MKLIKFLQRKYFYFCNRNSFLYLSYTSTIQKLLRLEGKENIHIGERVIIQKLTWLAALPLTGSKECRLMIGDGTIIGHFNHIYATSSIIIGKDVLTADKVYISDNQHCYENINIPISKQKILQLEAVTIGNGTWIGENVCIMGASIGCNCVIGANSVVTKNIPDYCIAVGAPAKVIKKYNLEKKTWEKV